ncbi:MAG: methionyl-tRNA formyltransferase [Deltaproteobacteria bacterium]|nr:methionyl-tRNA formyltransferase [Deltaproteobacteria bacterium]
MRLLFFGTAAFAVPSLERLHTSGHILVGAVTQPDRPAGRGRQVTASPIAHAARRLGFSVLQPPSLKDSATLEALRGMQPDCIVVVAYGNFLPPALLALPPKCCINIHPSLLPKYRGAAPINWAILNGDAVTGVTTMYLSERMDAGDILLQREVVIHPTESAAELGERLAPLGAELLVATLDGIAAGTVAAIPQDPAKAVMAPALAKADGRIDWRRPARILFNQIRGMQPWPNAYTHCQNARLTIFRAEVLDDTVDAAPGTVVQCTRAIHVATGDRRQICLTDVQPAGGKRMPAQDFLRGHHLAPGLVLGA